MMFAIKLALKNLLGNKLRTALSVLVLSFVYVAIIGTQGIYDGMDAQGTRLRIDAELGGGQFWHKNYDPYDPFSLADAHAPLPVEAKRAIEKGDLLPILIERATIYPNNEIKSVLMKGIPAAQTFLQIPADVLADSSDGIPVLIGGRMAKECGLSVGDYFTLRWRDVHGGYDARDARVVHIMQTGVQTIDVGQIWLPLARVQALLDCPEHATLLVVAPGKQINLAGTNWTFHSTDDLLADLREVVKQKKIGSMFMFVILLFLAMIAIFDSQILSIFRRRKEIGTLVALGMTRGLVVWLFTLEGAMHGILAALAGAIYGSPLLYYFAKIGWQLPKSTDSYGFALGSVLYPVYSAVLILATVLIVMITVLIVSYLPARRIAKMHPVNALRGKLQ